jgi:hypothetical protein
LEVVPDEFAGGCFVVNEEGGEGCLPGGCFHDRMFIAVRVSGGWR